MIKARIDKQLTKTYCMKNDLFFNDILKINFHNYVISPVVRLRPNEMRYKKMYFYSIRCHRKGERCVFYACIALIPAPWRESELYESSSYVSFMQLYNSFLFL